MTVELSQLAAKLTEADWPTFEVGLYGFGECYIEAPSRASARWCAASKCHEAGYGSSPIELIQRGVTIREGSSTLAIAMGGPHYRVEPKRLRAHLASTEVKP